MTAPDIRIRPAVTEDLDGVRRVLTETWHDTYDPIIGRDKVAEMVGKWHTVEALAAQLVLPDTSFLVAERGADGIVGHAFGNAQQVPALYLARLYVLPGHQRQGIGGRLLAALVERHPQATTVRLTVEADNAKGVAFYRRQGFTTVSEAVEEGLKILRMEKVLDTDESNN